MDTVGDGCCNLLHKVVLLEAEAEDGISGN